MIKRIYVHNFRSLINFELAPQQLLLLMGSNGAGKSAVFDLLDKIRRLVSDGERLENVFPSSDLSHLTDPKEAQTLQIEVELASPAGTYLYQLTIEYAAAAKKQRIQSEALSIDGKPLFSCTNGETQLYRDDHSLGPAFPMDWGQSGVGFLMAGKDNTRLTWFKERVGRIYVIRLDPFQINDESREEANRPAKDMSNFADWYRHLVQTRFESVQQTLDELKARLPGFKVLSAVELGDARLLRATFEDKQAYRLSQLSEGQRALITLYTLIYGVANDQGATLCIDEPENFLALPEIQPWLDALHDLVEDGHLQALLISHHPRLMNFLAAGHGQWLERHQGLGPTRCKTIGPSGSGAQLDMDELVERGWIDAD